MQRVNLGVSSVVDIILVLCANEVLQLVMLRWDSDRNEFRFLVTYLGLCRQWACESNCHVAQKKREPLGNKDARMRSLTVCKAREKGTEAKW